jgi:AraC-like DNA-binding protein
MEPLCTPVSVVVRESKLSIRVVRAVVEAVEQSGIPPAHFLRAAQFDASQLSCEDACVPRAVVYRLCELAVELTRDPAFGLHWGERLGANTFNPLSHLVAHSATLRQGFQSLLQFHKLLSHSPSFQVHEHDDKVTLRCFRLTGESSLMQRLTAEMQAIGFLRTLRMFDPHAWPDRVCFEYSAPPYAAEYTRVFDHREHFDQDFTGFVFSRALMDKPSPHRDADVHAALRGIAERRVMRQTQSEPIALRVRDVLVQQGATHRVEMDVVAKILGLSSRSLRRRLVAEGVSYHAIVNDALAIVAKQYLRNRQHTIQETAYEMGFSDTSTFHRAFKRWTGMTPNEFREEQARSSTPVAGETQVDSWFFSR